MNSILSPHCFGQEWIREQARQLKAQDAQNLEKAILALELVGRLTRSKLKFVFKGGTCLMLHLDPIRRLSIDVDIACLEKQNRLEEILNNVARRQKPFTKWEHQKHRDREAPPTQHFKIYYESSLNQQEASIQLDLMKIEEDYPKIVTLDLPGSFVQIEEPVKIPVPSLDCLAADKLAAFAPNTIGYPYEPLSKTGDPLEPRPIKVAKHLYDLNELFPHITDFSLFERTYLQIAREQIQFRQLNIEPQECLIDTIKTSHIVSRLRAAKKGLPAKERTFLANGITSLKSHLFNQPFGSIESEIAGGRAALLAAMLVTGNLDLDLSPYHKHIGKLPAGDKRKLKDSYAPMNNLRSTNATAFELWHQTSEIYQP